MKINPIILILLLAAFNAYSPHISYPYPLHVDEWFHITTAEEIVRGDKIDLYSGTPFRLGMERAWHSALAGIFFIFPPSSLNILPTMFYECSQRAQQCPSSIRWMNGGSQAWSQRTGR